MGVVVYPVITVLAFVTIIGVWTIFTGAAQAAAAIRLRREIDGEWLLILSGVLSILFGGLFLFSPFLGALSLAYYVRIYALLAGVPLISLGLKLRKLGNGATRQVVQSA